MKGVAEALVQGLVGFLVGPDVDGARAGGVEAAEVVEAHDVVGVGVGVDDGLDVIDAVGDALEAELGRRCRRGC
jgi:hypothetical protein